MIKIRKTKYTKNEDFFATPNLQNCWVSGFIAGDGYLVNNGKYKNVGIELKDRDIDILEYIKSVTLFTGKLYNRIRKFKIKDRNNLKFYEGESKTVSIKFHSANKWCEDLNKNWNLIPNKVKRLGGPNINDLKLCLAFISGNICADGNINYFHNKTRNSKAFNITFLGTHKFLTWIKNTLDKIVKDPSGSIVRQERKTSNIKCYKIGSIKSYLISKMILSLDVFHMERKWQTARDYIKAVENFEASSRFRSRLRKLLTPEIINFVKGTNQEFPEDFLIKIGYLNKNNENSNSQSQKLLVNT